MPLLRRRPVQLLPLPDLDSLSHDTPVFYLKATGEVFLDYECVPRASLHPPWVRC